MWKPTIADSPRQNVQQGMPGHTHLSVDFLPCKRLNGTKGFSPFPDRRGMGDLLLRILGEHQGRFVSGEEIGRRMGTSRAAGWKPVRTLGRRGVGVGGGRGRFARRWEPPPGVNLYLSLLLRPPVDPAQAPQLTLVASVALAKAVEEVAKIPARLKWPNDLYLAGKKAAGILAEMSTDADRLRHVVIGVGLNVNAEESDFPPGLRGSATSLRLASGRTIPRAEVLARFLDRFAEGYREFLSGGLQPLLPDWIRRSLSARERE